MMGWSVGQWADIAQHSAVVASLLKELQKSSSNADSGACPMSFSLNDVFQKHSSAPLGIQRKLKAERDVFERIFDSASVRSSASADKEVPDQVNADSKLLKNTSALEQIRNTERNKKRRLRDRTAQLIKSLDDLIPPQATNRPRSFHDTLAETVKAVRRACSPIDFKGSVLSVHSAGLLVLDPDLAVVASNDRFAEIVGGRRPQPGLSSRKLVVSDDFDDLQLVATELMRTHNSEVRSDNDCYSDSQPVPDRFVIGLRFHGAASELPVEIIWCTALPTRTSESLNISRKCRGAFFAFVLPLFPVSHPSACPARAVWNQTGIRPGFPSYFRLIVEQTPPAPRGNGAPINGSKSHGALLGGLPLTTFAAAQGTEFLLRGLRSGDWSDAETWLSAHPEYPDRDRLLSAIRDLSSVERRGGEASGGAGGADRTSDGGGCVTEFVLVDGGGAASGDSTIPGKMPRPGLPVIRVRILVGGLCMQESNLLGGGANRMAFKSDIPRHSQLRVADLLAPESENKSEAKDSRSDSSPTGKPGSMDRDGAGGELNLELVGERQNELRVLEGGHGVWFSRHVCFAPPLSADSSTTAEHPATHKTVSIRKSLLSMREADGGIRIQQLEVKAREARSKCIRYFRVQPPPQGGAAWMAWPAREPEGLSGLALRNALLDLYAAMRDSERSEGPERDDGSGERSSTGEDTPGLLQTASEGGLDLAATSQAALWGLDSEWWEELGLGGMQSFGQDLDWL